MFKERYITYKHEECCLGPWVLDVSNRCLKGDLLRDVVIGSIGQLLEGNININTSPWKLGFVGTRWV